MKPTLSKQFISPFLLCALSITLFSQLSSAKALIGGSDGGGGIGVRCADQLELLDLHEAKINGLSLAQTPQSQDEAIDLVASLLINNYWNPSTIPVPQMIASTEASLFRPIFIATEFTGPDNLPIKINYVASLPLSEDLGNYQIAAGCQLEQIAYFSDKDASLNIVKDKWDQLNWLSKSALVAHEVVYFLDRREGLENINSISPSTSERTRGFVGKLFSTTPPPTKSNSIPLTTHMEGNAGGGLDYFYAYNSAPNELTTVFNIIDDRSSPYQIRAVFQGISQEILLDQDSGSGQASAAIEFVGEHNTPSLYLYLTKAPGSAPTLQAFFNQAGTLIPIDSSPLSIEVYSPAQSQPGKYIDPGKDITQEFLKKYTGTFVDEGYSDENKHQSYKITSDGQYQYSTFGGSSDNNSVCSYTFSGKIVSVIARSADDMKTYIDFATHIINFSEETVILNEDFDSPKNPDCQSDLKEYQTAIAANPNFPRSVYSELFKNGFRTQTTGGGDYIDGTGMARTPSTLDEMYTRQ